MAMINCKDCGKEVSDTALKCPSCGVQLRKAKRTVMGKVFLLLFIFFNILMIAWIWAGVSATQDVMQTAGSELEEAGTAIGAGIGTTMLVIVWVLGDIILGLPVLFTRPKS
tara:strand:- start:1627 stop:1959 length:333 start_codon:yes stop_codon:yes gene_type:complete